MSLRLQHLPALWRDSAGASIMETALMLPILIGLFAGLADFGLGFAQKLRTQQAAARAIEFATVGGPMGIDTTTLTAEAAAGAGVPASRVSVDIWLECSGVRQANLYAVCASSMDIARYAQVNIANSYRPMFAALLPNVFTGDGTMNYTARASTRLQ